MSIGVLIILLVAAVLLIAGFIIVEGVLEGGNENPLHKNNTSHRKDSNG